MSDICGPTRPAAYVAEAFARRKHRVYLVSTRISDNVKELLRSYNVIPIDLKAKMIMSGGSSLLWFEAWLREAFLTLNSKKASIRSDVTINFSYTIAMPADIWYVQGPVVDFLKDASHEFPTLYNIVYNGSKLLLNITEKRFLRKMASISRYVVANSKFCASMYKKRGIKVYDILYPPLDCSLFKPTSNPSNDYVLTYFGKETRFDLPKKVADKGVRIKAFGSKASYLPDKVLSHKNIEFLGRVSEKELINLYSNACFTLFTFSHEPFGYIPVESMACGTPVLTHNRQGPAETVVNGTTGWLANTDEKLVSLAQRLWNSSYSVTMRLSARKRASMYDLKPTTKRWIKLVEKIIQDGS